MGWNRSRLWACRLFAQPAIQNGAVGVDAAIAEKRPVAARVFAFCRVALDDEDFLFIVGSFGGDLAERIGDERISPEFETGIAIGGLSFESDAIYNPDLDAVGDRVGSLDWFPGVEVCGAAIRVFVGMPPQAGAIAK